MPGAQTWSHVCTFLRCLRHSIPTLNHRLFPSFVPFTFVAFFSFQPFLQVTSLEDIKTKRCVENVVRANREKVNNRYDFVRACCEPGSLRQQQRNEESLRVAPYMLTGVKLLRVRHAQKSRGQFGQRYTIRFCASTPPWRWARRKRKKERWPTHAEPKFERHLVIYGLPQQKMWPKTKALPLVELSANRATAFGILPFTHLEEG